MKWAITILLITKVFCLEAQVVDTSYMLTTNTKIELYKDVLKRITYIDQNKRTGYRASFFFSTLLQSENYINDTIHGAQILYDPNGMPLEIEMYSMGVRFGKSYYFYENGNLRAIVNYEDDRKEGRSFFYNPDGILRYYETYSHDLLNGPCVGYYEGTTLIEYEINFLNDQKNGYCTYYNEDGTIRLVQEYVNGNLVE